MPVTETLFVAEIFLQSLLSLAMVSKSISMTQLRIRISSSRHHDNTTCIMSPYTLYFIRHGEALHNQLEKLAENTALAESLAKGYDVHSIQAQIAVEQARKRALMGINVMEDPPLSELGMEEARQVRTTLSHLVEAYNLPMIEEVWVSPLRRAMETAGQIFPECFVLSKDKGLDTTSSSSTTTTSQQQPPTIIIPKIRVRKEIEERQTGLLCDSHTTYENIVRRLNLKKLSISFLKLDKKALGGLSSGSLATTASTGGKMSGDTLVSSSSNNKSLSGNSLASIGEDRVASTTTATTATIWEDKFDSSSSIGGGAATNALIMETIQSSEMSTNNIASIGEDDITSSTSLPAVPEWEDKLSYIESEFDILSKKKMDNQVNVVNSDTHCDEIPYGTTKFIEDKTMLRERTKKLFDMLSQTTSRSICLIGHKGYLRELERGPLGQTDAELFRNCEIRVYRLELEATDNNTNSEVGGGSNNSSSSSGGGVMDAQGRTLLHSAEKVTSS